jgi:hypothetical protein
MIEELSINRPRQINKKKRLYKRILKLIRAILAWIIILMAAAMLMIEASRVFKHYDQFFKMADNSPNSLLDAYLLEAPPSSNSPELINQLMALKASDGTLSKKIDSIIANKDTYSEEMLKLLIRNSETIDFVLDYPSQAGIEVLGDIRLEDDVTAGKIPLFLQWDKRWGYASYGNGIIGLDGCGPTSLAMVAVGLTGNLTYSPMYVAKFSEEAGYFISGSGTAWALMKEGASHFGLTSQEISLGERVMIKHLDQGHPIIASMSPGDFTSSGHFIVIHGYNEEGFYVHDSNSNTRSHQVWPYAVLEGQIKNMWAFSS